MTVTTADCKKFLVNFFEKNPSVVTSVFYTAGKPMTADEIASKLELEQWAINPKMWSRRSKYRVGGKNDNLFPYSRNGIYETLVYSINVPVRRSGYDGTTHVVKSQFVWVREFFLNDDVLEGQCGFAVLEDKDGNLHLGEYVGD